MKYKSTRGGINNLGFKEAVLMGLASDSGLIIPSNIPNIDIHSLKSLPYRELALRIFLQFADDIEEGTLRKLIQKSYENFDIPEIVNLIKLKEVYILELFYGPSLSFKDIALQFLGNLFEYILEEHKTHMNVLGATSGDTGSAAIYALKGKKNIKVFMLYPYRRISELQELQMTAIEEENVFPLAIKGNFDDCQRIVKELFSDLEFKHNYHLGAVNSINWARILAQIVYYFYAYFKIQEELYFSVPTGNFGNIFAGYLARRMGLPIKRLILATNENDILTRLINEGDYSIKNVIRTLSPAMDIQVPSNLERYLYYLYEENPFVLKEKMEEFKKNKKIKFSKEDIARIQGDFVSYSVNQRESLQIIKEIYKKHKYLLCPHTSCGVRAGLKIGDTAKKVCLATAHPAKFPEVAEKAGVPASKSAKIESLKNREKKNYILENNKEEVKKFIIAHS